MAHPISATFFQQRFGTLYRQTGSLIPGLALAGGLSLLAIKMASLTILPAVLIGLLLGMAVAGLAARPVFTPGLDFASRELLRVGVALLGARVTIGEMVEIGAGAAAIAVGGLILCLALGYKLARLVKLPQELAFLTASAVAICGASAALAVAAVLPRSPTRQQHVAATVAAITVIGTLAMLALPALAVALGLNADAAGVLFGSTLHEVVQAVGAGFTHSPQAGEVATTVKLVRVACLAPVVMLIGWWSARGGETGERPPLLPLFLIGFLFFAALSSFGLIAPGVQLLLGDVSRFFLLAAIVGLGAKIAPRQLREFGWRPILVIALQTLALMGFGLGAVLLLYR